MSLLAETKRCFMSATNFSQFFIAYIVTFEHVVGNPSVIEGQTANILTS